MVVSVVVPTASKKRPEPLSSRGTRNPGSTTNGIIVDFSTGASRSTRTGSFFLKNNHLIVIFKLMRANEK